MNGFPPKEIVEARRKQFPSGAKVVLDYMDDAFAPKVGTEGRVLDVDDIGTVHVVWSTGQALGAVYGEDRIHRV